MARPFSRRSCGPHWQCQPELRPARGVVIVPTASTMTEHMVTPSLLTRMEVV
jgi:hypothetical protein